MHALAPVVLAFLAACAALACKRGDEGRAPAPAVSATTIASGAASQSVDTIAIENAPGTTPVPSPGVAPPGPRAPGIDGDPGPSPAMGPANAPVEVWIFSDFQCPVCRRTVEPMKHLVRSYPGEVRVVFKHNALDAHKRAAAAAAAAIAAQRQGKFWEFHDRVFTDPSRMSDDDLAAVARALGLDVDRFAKDRDDPAVKAQIRYESRLAAALGAESTPGLFVNGRKQVGWGSYTGLASMVEAALREAKEVAASGVPAADVARRATAKAGDEGKLFAKLAWGLR